MAFSVTTPLAAPNAALPDFPGEAGGVRENFTLPGPNGAERTVRVFLPSNYRSAPSAAYPLLLMQDGQNLFEDETAFGKVSWKLGAALMDGKRAGTLRDVIAVGVDNAGFDRVDEYAPWRDDEIGRGGGAARYAEWIKNTLMPELERRYRLLPGRANRIIGGSSLGAVVSLYALAEHPELFGGAILMSAPWWWQKNSLHDWIKTRWPTPPAGTRLWLDAGDAEDNGADAFAMRDTLKSVGFVEGRNLAFFMAPGGRHNEASWGARVHLPLRYFFPA